MVFVSFPREKNGKLGKIVKKKNDNNLEKQPWCWCLALTDTLHRPPMVY